MCRRLRPPHRAFQRVASFFRWNLWIEYAKKGDLLEKSPTQLYATYHICGDHFTADDFMDFGMTSLRKTAIPSVQPAGYWDCQLAQSGVFAWCLRLHQKIAIIAFYEECKLTIVLL
ncbi:hypothetical protein V5799_033665 [Amblyomma americanum]|uniref:THAP-type domain-containing protein n=1 Tax=Amblyomma americanum TaxID=6943 RepID=A0AAQ4DMN6_AMBAM